MDNGKLPKNMALPPAPTSSVYYQELAADFIEQEVGRQRWKQNLSAMAANKTLRPTLDRWLRVMNIQAKPELVLHAISELLQRGQWVYSRPPMANPR